MGISKDPNSKVGDLTIAELKIIIFEIVQDIINNIIKDKDLAGNKHLNSIKDATENYSSNKITENLQETKKFIYWQEDNMWLGYLSEYPDYMTQGESLEELKDNLKDIFSDLSSGAIPNIRKVGELKVA